MTGLALDGMLGLMVLSAWLGAAGFARLRAPLDRLHCSAFVAATSGPCLVVAAFLADGPSARALKILFLWLILLIFGGALSHAVGRAVAARGPAP
jgi:multisubunit Na+/H+ antiporter MnhG subunit